MTIRMATCEELASDLSEITKLQKHYWNLERSATPTSLLLPWFPSPASRVKQASTKALFETLQSYIEERKKASAPNSDAIDLLLGQGWSDELINQFVLGIIFAGTVTTGINGMSLDKFIVSNANFERPSVLGLTLHLLPLTVEICHTK
jgi:cytochrome P450